MIPLDLRLYPPVLPEFDRLRSQFRNNLSLTVSTGYCSPLPILAATGTVDLGPSGGLAITSHAAVDARCPHRETAGNKTNHPVAQGDNRRSPRGPVSSRSRSAHSPPLCLRVSVFALEDTSQQPKVLPPLARGYLKGLGAVRRISGITIR